MNYTKKRLGDICRFEYGKNLTEKDRIEGNFNVYGSNGKIGTNMRAFTTGKTIIIGRKGSIGQVLFSDEPCWPIDTTYYIDEKGTECDLFWLALLLKSLQLEKLNKASGVPGLNRDDAYELMVSVPDSKKHQRLIALHLRSQLSEIEKAKEATEIQLQEVINLANAIIFESLNKSDKTTNSLGDVLEEVKHGIGKNWRDYPVYGATRKGIALAKEPPGKQAQKYKPVIPGTVFYNPMRILIGSIAFAEEDVIDGITSPDYVVLKGKEGLVDSRWFYFWLRSPWGEQCINSLARGAVRERMLFNRLAEGQIELPDYTIQKKASEALSNLKSLSINLVQQLMEIGTLPNRILAQAFSEIEKG